MLRFHSLLVGSALLLSGCGGDASIDAGSDVTSPCAGAADGTACDEARVCVAGSCVESTCGDGVLDTRSEQCEDGNDVAFDGCEPDTCQLTCASDDACDDGNACNGTETCPESTHACAAGTPSTMALRARSREAAPGYAALKTAWARGVATASPSPAKHATTGTTTPRTARRLRARSPGRR